MHELPLIVFQIDYSKCPIQLPPVPPAHHLPMRVLAQMRHRKLGETGGHGHSNLHLEPTLASWHPRMARPRALAQASVERPRDEASPATSWRPAGASQLLPPATLLHSIGLLRQAREATARALPQGACTGGATTRRRIAPIISSRAGSGRGVRQNRPKMPLLDVLTVRGGDAR